MSDCATSRATNRLGAPNRFWRADLDLPLRDISAFTRALAAGGRILIRHGGVASFFAVKPGATTAPARSRSRAFGRQGVYEALRAFGRSAAALIAPHHERVVMDVACASNDSVHEPMRLLWIDELQQPLSPTPLPHAGEGLLSSGSDGFWFSGRYGAIRKGGSPTKIGVLDVAASASFPGPNRNQPNE